MAGSVKRSLSTPNVQHTAVVADGGSHAYSVDKRRNKLGYHRTSVACGHCRRRKIRCQLDKDDSHGRCANCIRLKKECNFYPVESVARRPKPDNSINHEPVSNGSSPSPGYGISKLQPTEAHRGYPASVPVTPTYFPGSIDDGFRRGSFASSTGHLAGSRSTGVSRKPSLAHMHVLPLVLKAEQGYLSPHAHDGFPRRWLSNQADPSAPVTPVTPITSHHRAQLEDPSTAFWRLNSSELPSTAPYIPPQPKVEGMTSFSSIDSADLGDDGWSSQVPSRVGSVDHGIGSGYSFSHSFDGEYAPPPELCSATASTVSLSASLSEASKYAGESRTASDQFYAGQWDTAVGNSYSVDMPVKQEPFDANHQSYPPDVRYSQINEENPFLFPSPLHSPAPVGMSHV